MGLFSKKEKVPEVPPTSTLPDLPSKGKKDLPELPSFPNNSKNDNLNQDMVKSAVSDLPSGEKEDDFGALPELQVEEVNEGENLIPSKPSSYEIPEIETVPQKKSPSYEGKLQPPGRTLEINQERTEKPSTKPLEPIFVRIDKFQAAQKDFEQIREKVKDIEDVIKTIKDVKSKEEKELNSWGDEMEKLKSRLSEIDSNIFSQM